MIRRLALGAALATGATGSAVLAIRPLTPVPATTPPPAAPAAPSLLPWRLLRDWIDAGRPNGRLGLVQAQHIFGKVGAGGGLALVRGGLVRVRIPANLARLGDEGWQRDRFEDGWWMERLRDLGIPFKVVVELWPRFSDETHAEHAARVVRRVRPDTVIVGNELNTAYLRPGLNPAEEIERYLGQYAAISAAVRRERPETRIQLYGEAYDGDPADPGAFLRRVLHAFRQRGLPPPDAVGIHVYDRAEVLPARLAGYRRLLADFGLRLPVAVEELGPRQGIVDKWERRALEQTPALDAACHVNRFTELRAQGWLTEAEQADLVAQHLATAATCADQAQVFCAIDFDAELSHRRGLVSGAYDRQRLALGAFRFLQRLLNELEEARLVGSDPDVRSVAIVRCDGLRASLHWRAAGGESAASPAADRHATAGGRPATLDVPPFTFVSDALGRLVALPLPHAQMIELPAPTTPEAGGAVRVLI